MYVLPCFSIEVEGQKNLSALLPSSGGTKTPGQGICQKMTNLFFLF